MDGWSSSTAASEIAGALARQSFLCALFVSGSGALMDQLAFGVVPGPGESSVAHLKQCSDVFGWAVGDLASVKGILGWWGDEEVDLGFHAALYSRGLVSPGELPGPGSPAVMSALVDAVAYGVSATLRGGWSSDVDDQATCRLARRTAQLCVQEVGESLGLQSHRAWQTLDLFPTLGHPSREVRTGRFSELVRGYDRYQLDAQPPV